MLLASVRNAYTMGKVRMVATEHETAGRLTKNHNAGSGGEPGRFVLWQMAPDVSYWLLLLLCSFARYCERY